VSLGATIEPVERVGTGCGGESVESDEDASGFDEGATVGSASACSADGVPPTLFRASSDGVASSGGGSDAI
jgi:hypothetical protein